MRETGKEKIMKKYSFWFLMVVDQYSGLELGTGAKASDSLEKKFKKVQLFFA